MRARLLSILAFYQRRFTSGGPFLFIAREFARKFFLFGLAHPLASRQKMAAIEKGDLIAIGTEGGGGSILARRSVHPVTVWVGSVLRVRWDNLLAAAEGSNCCITRDRFREGRVSIRPREGRIYCCLNGSKSV